jgi:hypothetical protein
MTDAIDRRIAAEPDEEQAAAPSATTAPPARPADPPRSSRPELWLMAALLAGAALIHAAMVPSHLGESAVEGAGFLVAAWVQVLLAVGVLLRPTRRLFLAVVVTSAVLIAAWVVSRTAGLPFGAHAGHAESVSVVDGVCVALEAVALFLAGALAMSAPRGVPEGRGGRLAAVAGAVGAVVLATAAVSSPSARDHAAGSHGDHAAGAQGAEASGHDHGTSPGADLGFSQLANGHQHDRGVEPLTPAETVDLAGQLAVTAELVQMYPTIADAEAAGWTRSGPFSPGLGTHYGAPAFHMNADGVMDTREDLLSPMLVFDGLGRDARLAGFMYIVYGSDTEPAGFAGPNDHWHYHERVCIVMGDDGAIDTPFGADLEGVTEQMCTDAGGAFIENTGYMVHAWSVPGYESPDGMFTELNPKITCPDGTYHRIALEDLGSKDSVCLNP